MKLPVLISPSKIAMQISSDALLLKPRSLQICLLGSSSSGFAFHFRTLDLTNIVRGSSVHRSHASHGQEREHGSIAPPPFLHPTSILQAVKIASCKQHGSAHSCTKELEDDIRVCTPVLIYWHAFDRVPTGAFIIGSDAAIVLHAEAVRAVGHVTR